MDDGCSHRNQQGPNVFFSSSQSKQLFNLTAGERLPALVNKVLVKSFVRLFSVLKFWPVRGVKGGGGGGGGGRLNLLC